MHQPLAYVHPQSKIARNVVIEPFVTISKNVEIGEGTWIGSNVTIMEGAKIGKNCLVGAGALVTEGKEFPDNSLIIGTPAKTVRSLNEEDIARMHGNTSNYVERGQFFKTNLKRIG